MKKSGKIKGEYGRDNRNVQWYITPERRNSISDPENRKLDERFNELVRNAYNWKLLYTHEKKEELRESEICMGNSDFNTPAIKKEWWQDSWIIENEDCFLLTVNKDNGKDYDLFATGTASFSLEYHNPSFDHITSIYNKIKDYTSIHELITEFGFTYARRRDPLTLEKFKRGTK